MMVGILEKQQRHLRKLNKNQKGENNRNWKGGINQVYYTKLAKEELKQECYFCEKIKILDIHHIDMDKKNNVITNLLMLCRSCHKKLHSILKIYERRCKDNRTIL